MIDIRHSDEEDVHMQTYLDENFFEAVRKDMQKYSTDSDMAIERSRMLEYQEQERIASLGKCYEILERFGAIM